MLINKHQTLGKNWTYKKMVIKDNTKQNTDLRLKSNGSNKYSSSSFNPHLTIPPILNLLPLNWHYLGYFSM